MCVKVKGNNITDGKEDHKFFEGNAFDNYNDSLKFFSRYNAAPFVIEGSIRKNYFDYPEKAFRELLANAISHRDYTIVGSQIAVWIYNNRVEIKSPGKIPNTLTIEKMKAGIRYHRNPVIVQYFYDANIVEKMGQGIPNANKWLSENGNSELDIREDGDEIIATMHNSTPTDKLPL